MGDRREEADNRPREFRPWHYNHIEVPCKIFVDEPPCKDCINWNPRIKTDAKGNYDGVVLCIADKMYSDFSCYKAKRE